MNIENEDKKRKMFLISCGCWFFLSGMDYSIVLPTLHLYLKSVSAETYYLGIVISALSFGAMLSAPVYARITDKIQSAKNILRIGILFSIVGNCMYCLIQQKNAIVGARFISGVGWGLEGALMGQIGRTYKTANKTQSFAIVLMMRQLGVVSGPFCILFLRKMEFTWNITDNFTINITKYSVVGLFLACMWSLIWVVILFLYNDPPPEKEDEENNNNISPKNTISRSSPEPLVKKKFRVTKKSWIGS